MISVSSCNSGYLSSKNINYCKPSDNISGVTPLQNPHQHYLVNVIASIGSVVRELFPSRLIELVSENVCQYIFRLVPHSAGSGQRHKAWP